MKSAVKKSVEVQTSAIESDSQIVDSCEAAIVVDLQGYNAMLLDQINENQVAFENMTEIHSVAIRELTQAHELKLSSIQAE